MKIKHKYLRNRVFRSKHWNRVRSKENPYRTFYPYFYGRMVSSYEKQVESHFNEIKEEARAIENGCHPGRYSSTSSFRRFLNKERKAIERQAMSKIRKGDYDIPFPVFKKDADWLYF
jgi:hypothetical protein